MTQECPVSFLAPTAPESHSHKISLQLSNDFPDPAELIREMREERTDRILETVDELELIRKLESEFDERFAELCQRAGVDCIDEVELP